MHFEFLADRVEAIPVVAKWYFEEWGHLDVDLTLEKFSAAIGKQLGRDHLPLMILAVEDDAIVGVAELKPHEMQSLYPDKGPWLGGVFVAPSYRHRGSASQLASRIAEIAESLGIERLFLQTAQLDGGLYSRLGWKPLEQVQYRGHDVLVMEKTLNARAGCSL